jgi:proteic killer suppression protein
MSIEAFAHKGLEEIFRKGRSRRIGHEYLKRLTTLLDALDGATSVVDLQGAYGFHALSGDRAGTFAMKVSGNWRLTFRFENGDAGAILDVDFEDYH